MKQVKLESGKGNELFIQLQGKGITLFSDKYQIVNDALAEELRSLGHKVEEISKTESKPKSEPKLIVKEKPKKKKLSVSERIVDVVEDLLDDGKLNRSNRE